MKIGIIGLGVVGKAHKFGFEKLGHQVSYHDIAYETRIIDIMDTDVVYLCVPTPAKINGECDTGIVESVVSELCSLSYSGVIAIKSTIKPGKTQEFIDKYNNTNICFCPEFLRERSAEIDFIENHSLLAVGTNDDIVYRKVLDCHGEYPKYCVQLSPTEGELLKYYSNVYNALRVVFANEMYDICSTMGADYDAIRKAFVKRGTSTGNYLLVNDNWRGYAGVCLPKDTKALANLAEELGLDLKLFKTIDEENDKFIATVPGGMRI